MMNKVTDVLTYQAKMIHFIICFHTQLEVFVQIKFHLGDEILLVSSWDEVHV